VTHNYEQGKIMHKQITKVTRQNQYHAKYDYFYTKRVKVSEYIRNANTIIRYVNDTVGVASNTSYVKI